MATKVDRIRKNGRPVQIVLRRLPAEVLSADTVAMVGEYVFLLKGEVLLAAYNVRRLTKDVDMQVVDHSRTPTTCVEWCTPWQPSRSPSA